MERGKKGEERSVWIRRRRRPCYAPIVVVVVFLSSRRPLVQCLDRPFLIHTYTVHFLNLATILLFLLAVPYLQVETLKIKNKEKMGEK